MVDIATNNLGTSQSLIQQRTDPLSGAKRFLVSTKLQDSKFDPNEYAKALGDIKREEARIIQDKIDDNLKKISKLRELKENTVSVSRFAKSLSNYLGPNTDTPNLWAQRYPTTFNTTGLDMSAQVRVTATNNANFQSFKINVIQMASSDQVLSTKTFANTTTGLSLLGNLVINGTTIPITDGSNGSINMSLLDISNAINLAFPNNTMQMNLFTVDGVNYTWQITTPSLSLPIDLTGTSQTILQGLGVPLNTSNNTLPAVTPLNNLLLNFTYNGLNITRSGTNIVSDLIPNVTIEVNAANTGPLTCTIDYDRLVLQTGFGEFVKAYNTLQKFARDQTAYEADKITPKEGACLHRSSVLKSEIFMLTGLLSAWVPGVSNTQPNNLSAIGLLVGGKSTGYMNLDRTNDIYLDEPTLDQLINSDSITQVLTVVGNQVSSSNPYFRVFSAPDFVQDDTLSGVPITFSVQNANGTLVGTFSATVNGTTITAPATLLEGGLFQGPPIVEGTPISPFNGINIGLKTTQSYSTNSFFSVSSTPNFIQNSTLSGVPVTLSVQNVNGSFVGTLSATINGSLVTETATTLANGVFQGASGGNFNGLAIMLNTTEMNSLTVNGAPISTTITATALDGININGTTVSTTVTATRGLLDRLQEMTDSYIDYQTGNIDIEIQNLEDKNYRDHEKVERLKIEAAREEERIILLFNRVRELEGYYKEMTDMMDIYTELLTARN